VDDAILYHPSPRPPLGTKTLVLDLDETLIHTEHCGQSAKLAGGEFVLKRPGLDSFLAYAAENFETFIYTYADRAYAEPIIRMIAPSLRPSHILYRDSCFLQNGQVYKDLDMLDREMKNVILVDDNKGTASFYRDNAIVVPAWRGSPIDTILTQALPDVLERCRAAEDVRTVIAQMGPQIRRWK
jgi:RNA polymerase II subunit A small phosphatase-like protein